LLNDKEVMGDYKNTLLQNIINIIIVGALIFLSTAYAVTTLFPNLLG